jgi:hypothetical protein
MGTTASQSPSPPPMAYSGGANAAPTIAVQSAPSAAAQARQAPRAERMAVQHYLAAHKKKSTAEKMWSSIKKSLNL